MAGFDTIWRTTKNNMFRNKWLSLSTIFVIAIVFTISIFFIATAIIGQKTVKYYETRAQVIVFFKRETPEEEIFKFRDRINDDSLVESIDYISKEEALEIYKEDFENDPDLVETITADTLPPSLGVRAKSIEDLETIIRNINNEKEVNAYVDEVFYFKDVVDSIKTLSKVIGYGAIILITGLSIVTFALIMVTIRFNLLAHKNEIEIMHLVGSTDTFIKVPFLMQGALYGSIGALISTIIILTPWYLAMYSFRNSDFYFWLSQFLTDLSLGFLKSFNILFFLGFVGSVLLVGVIFGVISSYAAVVRHLNLSEK
jgi:cell division transport system permease protein